MNESVKRNSEKKEKTAEIAGSEAKTFYEFVKAHNLAFDGLRLGQRFVCLYVKHWPELFYKQSDSEAMKMIEDYLTQYQYFDKMPRVIR